jgi:hypothetical protein
VREWYGIVNQYYCTCIIDRVNEGGGGGGIVAKESNVMECKPRRESECGEE